MPNKIANHKRNYSFLLEKSLIAQVDTEASRVKVTRTDIVKKSLREHLKLDPIPASSSEIDALMLEIKGLKEEISIIVSKQNKQLDIKEIKNLLDQPKNKKSSWFSRLFKNS